MRHPSLAAIIGSRATHDDLSENTSLPAVVKEEDIIEALTVVGARDNGLTSTALFKFIVDHTHDMNVDDVQNLLTSIRDPLQDVQNHSSDSRKVSVVQSVVQGYLRSGLSLPVFSSVNKIFGCPLLEVLCEADHEVLGVSMASTYAARGPESMYTALQLAGGAKEEAIKCSRGNPSRVAIYNRLSVRLQVCAALSSPCVKHTSAIMHLSWSSLRTTYLEDVPTSLGWKCGLLRRWVPHTGAFVARPYHPARPRRR